MSEEIYKVVDILDSHDIVINAGSENNTKKGDVFEIFGKGKSVKDPDTGEALGFLDNIKETVTVIQIFPKMCVCSHISDETTIAYIATSVNKMYTSKYKKILNIDKDQIQTDDGNDKTIRIGDKVRKKTDINDFKSTKD